MKKNIRFVCLLNVIILYLLIFLATPQKLNASSLSISPPIITIRAMPPADISAQFSISNLDKEPIELQLVLKPFRATNEKNGEIQFIEPDQLGSQMKDILGKIKIYDGNIILEGNLTLAPRQRKNLTLRVNIPKDYTASDLYFSIVFLTIPKRDSNLSHSLISQGIGNNILLSIGGGEKTDGEITIFDSETFFNEGVVDFDLEIVNKSNFFISPEGSITIKNILGQTVDKIKLDRVNILANSSRLLSNYKERDYRSLNGKSGNNKKPKIIWSKPFILGYYTANLEIKLSENSPTKINKSISFIAFPAKSVIIMLISIALLATFVKKVTQKLKIK